MKDQLVETFNQLNQQKAEEDKYLLINLKEMQQQLDSLEEWFVLKAEITKEQFNNTAKSWRGKAGN